MIEMNISNDNSLSVDDFISITYIVIVETQYLITILKQNKYFDV